MGKALAADLERRRAALHRRSAALRAPTNPADEPAFLAEFDAIEREAADVDAALRNLGRL
jgi:DNA-binding IclR family transcriptional regulator